MEARSYFLRDVFAKVIFQDQDLAVQSTAEDRRQKQLQYAYAGGALFVAVLILLFPTVAFFKNRELIQDTRKLFQAQQASRRHRLHGVASRWRTCGCCAIGSTSCASTGSEGPPTGMRFGMYRGDALFEPLSRFYGTAVRRTFVETVLVQDMKDLTGFAKKHEGEDAGAPDEREYARFFNLLKLNLFLTGPRTVRRAAPSGRPSAPGSSPTWGSAGATAPGSPRAPSASACSASTWIST